MTVDPQRLVASGGGVPRDEGPPQAVARVAARPAASLTPSTTPACKAGWKRESTAEPAPSVRAWTVLETRSAALCVAGASSTMPCFVCGTATPRLCDGGCNRELCVDCCFTVTSVGQLMCSDCGQRHRGLPAPPPQTRKRGFDLGFLPEEDCENIDTGSPMGARGRQHSGKDLRAVALRSSSAPGALPTPGSGCGGGTFGTTMGGAGTAATAAAAAAGGGCGWAASQHKPALPPSASWSALSPWPQQAQGGLAGHTSQQQQHLQHSGSMATAAAQPMFGAAGWVAPSPAPVAFAGGSFGGRGADGEEDEMMDADL